MEIGTGGPVSIPRLSRRSNCSTARCVEADGKIHLRVTFEYCEGEHYYKYSGWKRIWTVHTLYEQPLDHANVDDLHRLFADLVRTWYESHLRRNRDVLIKYLKQTFEKIETFNQ